MDGVCLTFPEQVNDFLVGQGLFINLPNKNILQVLRITSIKKFNYKMFLYGVSLLK